jgi:hypothetical protein
MDRRGSRKAVVESDRGVEELGVPALGGRAVDVEEEVFGAFVDNLQRRAGLDVDDASDRNLVALGRLAEVLVSVPRTGTYVSSWSMSLCRRPFAPGS